jgi:hypothetical protein
VKLGESGLKTSEKKLILFIIGLASTIQGFVILGIEPSLGQFDRVRHYVNLEVAITLIVAGIITMIVLLLYRGHPRE